MIKYNVLSIRCYTQHEDPKIAQIVYAAGLARLGVFRGTTFQLCPH